MEKTIGELIRKRRIELGMTQKELGEKCGIADSAVRKYESGKVNPKIKKLTDIANALDCDVLDLLPPDAISKSLVLLGRVKQGGDHMVADSSSDFDAYKQGLIDSDEKAYQLYMEKLSKPVKNLNELGRKVLLDHAESMSHHEDYSNLKVIAHKADGSETVTYGNET